MSATFSRTRFSVLLNSEMKIYFRFSGFPHNVHSNNICVWTRLTIKSAIARCVNMMSSRFGVLMRLLISKTNTVMFPIADITIKILCKQKIKALIKQGTRRDGKINSLSSFKPVDYYWQLMSRIEHHVLGHGLVYRLVCWWYECGGYQHITVHYRWLLNVRNHLWTLHLNHLQKLGISHSLW